MKVLNRQPKKGHFHLNYEIRNFVYESTLTSGGKKKTLYSYPGLPQCRQILYQLMPPGKPICISKFYQYHPGLN